MNPLLMMGGGDGVSVNTKRAMLENGLLDAPQPPIGVLQQPPAHVTPNPNPQMPVQQHAAPVPDQVRQLKQFLMQKFPEDIAERMAWQAYKSTQQRMGGRQAPPVGVLQTAENKDAAFDPEGEGYDYDAARAAGMQPQASGPNAGHWGSVVPVTPDLRKQYGLPDEAYMLLKGAKHPTWMKAVEGEAARGFKVIKIGNRYFSVPKDFNK